MGEIYVCEKCRAIIREYISPQWECKFCGGNEKIPLTRDEPQYYVKGGSVKK